MKEHGKEALVNEEECLRCHHDKKAFCDKCHGFPPSSHYSGQLALHARRGRRRRIPRTARPVTTRRTATQCHQVNHPNGWLQVHGGIAARGENACLVCHPSEHV